jgi:hypothetical protein
MATIPTTNNKVRVGTHEVVQGDIVVRHTLTKPTLVLQPPPPQIASPEGLTPTVDLPPHSECVPTLVRRVQSKMQMLVQHFQHNPHLAAPHFTVLTDALQTVDGDMNEITTVWYKLCGVYQATCRIMAKERLESVQTTSNDSSTFPGMLEQIKSLQAKVDVLEEGRQADHVRMETLRAHLLQANERIHGTQQNILLAAQRPNATLGQKAMGEVALLRAHAKASARQVDKLQRENQSLSRYMGTSQQGLAKGMAYLQACHSHMALGLAKGSTHEDEHRSTATSLKKEDKANHQDAHNKEEDDGNDSDCVIVDECPPPRKKRMRSSPSSSPKPGRKHVDTTQTK